MITICSFKSNTISSSNIHKGENKKNLEIRIIAFILVVEHLLTLDEVLFFIPALKQTILNSFIFETYTEKKEEKLNSSTCAKVIGFIIKREKCQKAVE